MKIAICLSGQPRSIEFASRSILHHFSDGRDGHNYDYFCHAWDYNTWKLQGITYSDNEVVDREWLIGQLNKFNPKSYIINSKEDVGSAREWRYPPNVLSVPYGSLLYSAMISNFLKREYEIENNFRYDCVFKVRYDSVFNPAYFPILPNIMPERTLYFSHNYRMPLEYNRFNASDCIYYGDSWGMDIASDLFRYVVEILPTLRQEDDIDHFGPGTLMTKYGGNLGIQMLRSADLPEVIYRKEVLGLDPLNQIHFNEIYNMHSSFYTKAAF